MSFGPTIASGDVTLRPAVDTDLLARRAFGVNAEIARMFGGSEPVDRPMTSAEATRWFAALGAEGRIEWIVEHEGNLLGTARLHRFDPARKRARFAIGFFVTSKLGRGIGTTATRLVLRYGFDELELAEIELVVLDFNARARSCYRACGFREIERVPSDVFDGRRRADDIVMVVAPASFAG